MSDPIDEFTVMIEFLKKYQHYLGGKQHVEGEPFHMIDYIYGLTDEGNTDKSLIVTNGDRLLHSLLYALGKTTDTSQPEFIEFRAKIVNHFTELMGNPPDLKINSISVKEYGNSKTHLGEDALKTACLLYKTNILVFSFKTDIPQVKFFYHPEHTPNKIIYLFNLNGNHYLPVSVERTGDVVLSDHVVSVTLLELIEDRLKHSPLELGGDIEQKVYINPELNPVFGDIIELICHLSVFDHHLKSQIEERLINDAVTPSNKEQVEKITTNPLIIELTEILRERTERGVRLDTLKPSEINDFLTRNMMKNNNYFALFSRALVSIETYRDDILDYYMRYQSIKAGGNEDLDVLKQELIQVHNPKLLEVEAAMREFLTNPVEPGDQQAMNDIMGFQFEEIRALDYELELLIGTTNAYVMPNLNNVIARKAMTSALLSKQRNVFGNITRSVQNAKRKLITPKQMQRLILFLAKRTRLNVSLDVNAAKYSGENEDVQTIIQLLKKNPDTQYFADVLVMIEKNRAMLYAFYYELEKTPIEDIVHKIKVYIAEVKESGKREFESAMNEFRKNTPGSLVQMERIITEQQEENMKLLYDFTQLLNNRLANKSRGIALTVLPEAALNPVGSNTAPPNLTQGGPQLSASKRSALQNVTTQNATRRSALQNVTTQNATRRSALQNVTTQSATKRIPPPKPPRPTQSALPTKLIIPNRFLPVNESLLSENATLQRSTHNVTHYNNAEHYKLTYRNRLNELERKQKSPKPKSPTKVNIPNPNLPVNDSLLLGIATLQRSTPKSPKSKSPSAPKSPKPKSPTKLNIPKQFLPVNDSLLSEIATLQRSTPKSPKPKSPSAPKTSPQKLNEDELRARYEKHMKNQQQIIENMSLAEAIKLQDEYDENKKASNQRASEELARQLESEELARQLESEDQNSNAKKLGISNRSYVDGLRLQEEFNAGLHR
jgi:hypothetical protein